MSTSLRKTMREQTQQAKQGKHGNTMQPETRSINKHVATIKQNRKTKGDTTTTTNNTTTA